MRLEDIAIHFADVVNRSRSLTPEESRMVSIVLARKEKPSRGWSRKDLSELRRMKAAGQRAPYIGRKLGRSPGAVNSMWRNMKRRDARG